MNKAQRLDSAVVYLDRVRGISRRFDRVVQRRIRRVMARLRWTEARNLATGAIASGGLR